MGDREEGLADAHAGGVWALFCEFRDWHLRELLGDLRRHDVPASRWDFYAAPFRIELVDELQALVRQLDRAP